MSRQAPITVITHNTGVTEVIGGYRTNQWPEVSLAKYKVKIAGRDAKDVEAQFKAITRDLYRLGRHDAVMPYLLRQKHVLIIE
jgi:hypothetical protein